MVQRLGQKIETALAQAGLNQAQLAERMNVTPQAVNKWVKTGRISKENLHRLAMITKSSLAWLMSSEDGYPPEGLEVREETGLDYFGAPGAINMKLLEACIAGLEKHLQETGLELTPDEKSQEVLALYKHFAEEEEVDTSKVVKLLDFAAKKGVSRDSGSGPGKTNIG